MGSCEGGVVGEGKLSSLKPRCGFVLQPNVAAPAATLGNQDYD
jgi:hypothetical protein